MPDILVVPVASSSTSPPSVSRPSQSVPHSAPKASSTSLVFKYSPSLSKKDINLLILFHGLGDTEDPFFALGKRLALPDTAVLAIRAPLQIPLLDEPAFQWYHSFLPPDFALNPNPDPSKTLSLLTAFLTHLISRQGCAWSPSDIHLFGFAQGGSVASELALAFARTPEAKGQRLGSLVTVAGPLLSHPSLLSTKNGTPVLALHRPVASLSSADEASLKRGFGEVQMVRLQGKGAGGGMLAGEGEWRVAMKFWASRLGRADSGAMGGGGDMYEVLSGGPKLG